MFASSESFLSTKPLLVAFKASCYQLPTSPLLDVCQPQAAFQDTWEYLLIIISFRGN